MPLEIPIQITIDLKLKNVNLHFPSTSRHDNIATDSLDLLRKVCYKSMHCYNVDTLKVQINFYFYQGNCYLTWKVI